MVHQGSASFSLNCHSCCCEGTSESGFKLIIGSEHFLLQPQTWPSLNTPLFDFQGLSTSCTKRLIFLVKVVKNYHHHPFQCDSRLQSLSLGQEELTLQMRCNSGNTLHTPKAKAPAKCFKFQPMCTKIWKQQKLPYAFQGSGESNLNIGSHKFFRAITGVSYATSLLHSNVYFDAE